MNSASFSNPRALALAAFLLWLVPRASRAEDSIRYKYEHYKEAGGRIAVETQGAYIEKDFGTGTHFKIEGILDAIAGATPNGQPAPAGSNQVPLANLHERRKAWGAELSHQLRRVSLAVGLANSRESDYVSNGWSLNTVTDFNQKNTTLLAGFAGTDDDIRVFFQTPRAKKRTNDAIIGVTQLLNPQTSVRFNLTWGRQRGYISDPYKLVQKNIEVFPGVSLPLTFAENRPDHREKWIALVVVNRAFPGARAALEATYRFYRDTFGTNAHTVDLAWFQRLGEKAILRPAFRFYDQTAARFYHYNLDRTAVLPRAGPPRPNGPFYSSDYRLSAMQTFTSGMKIIWDATAAWQLDAAFERYDMRGTDGVTPQSAYCTANIVTVGAKFSW
ncbi:MAG: DUF3570 domain-containing protein [Verrucomicrobia bacterium]|nr:DUF3570 domain-containing protein [Verrucomicrobiota bacterium]